MKFKDMVIEMTKKAAADLFRSARAMPEDRLAWQPEGQGRSALDILKECVQMGEAPLFFLGPNGPKEPTPDEYKKWQEEQKQWKTIDDCEKAFYEKFDNSIGAFKEINQDNLEKEVDFPFGKPGEKISMAGVMLSTYWQLVYHLGQVNYIQVLYGDKEMH